MPRLNSSFVLGYHGCDKKVGCGLLRGDPFKPSENDYDWLGNGIYFWEANPLRGLEFARELQMRRMGKPNQITEPYVIGAVIELGNCLDLISSIGIRAIERAHKSYMKFCGVGNVSPPQNVGGNDLLLRHLDCQVIEHLHEISEGGGIVSYDTVKALFREGGPVYENSGFYEKTHVQICVRNASMIRGVFQVPPGDLASLVT